jgi:hypothetical protein
MTANELIRGWGPMAGCYRYGNELSGCTKACGSLTVWACISSINFSRKTELTALMDKLPIHVCVCVLAWKTNDKTTLFCLIERFVLLNHRGRSYFQCPTDFIKSPTPSTAA